MTTNLWAQASADAGEFRREGNSFNADAYVAGVRAGMTDVEQLGDPVVGFGLFADYAMNNDFLVGGAIDYWERSSGTLTDNRLFVSDVALAANAKYVMSQVPIAVKPYLLAGASLHRISSEEETEALGI